MLSILILKEKLNNSWFNYFVNQFKFGAMVKCPCDFIELEKSFIFHYFVSFDVCCFTLYRLVMWCQQALLE